MRRRNGPLRLLREGLRAPGYSRRWVAGQVGVAAALSVVCSGMINLLLAPQRHYLSFWQLWLLVTAALLAAWFARPVREPPARPEVDPYGSPEVADRPYAIADRWARRLSVTSGNPEWFTRVARDRLAALVAERLRQRYGGRQPDPAILGEELYAFLTAPITRTPSPAELDRLITRMEQV